ncbi:MAG: zinc ABC transporter substrate-binding protein [candidate division Zixibacteria bacterium]|nr:zinc ABC transporter substrate-binding protein [candidate division Zixibacteria bacterium]
MGKKISVFVSILPQAFYVEQIGGEFVTVQVLVGPGQSPATYEPSPKQMSALAETPLYFRIGVPFERHLIGKIEKTFQALKIIDTREGVPLREIDGVEHHDHEYTGGKDPHIWLSPQLVKIQADNIYRALVGYDSARTDYYEKNLEKFKARLDETDAAIREKLAPFKGSRFYAFHPSYGYFADDYGLVQLAVEIEGREPSARQLAALIEHARAEKVRVIFVQPQFAVKTAETIARAIGGRVVQLDPLSGDYLNNLIYMADELARALGSQEKEK